MKKLEKSQFRANWWIGRSINVRYTTHQGDYYIKLLSQGCEIDAYNDVMNDDQPTQAAMSALRDMIKKGEHYRKNGKLIPELV